MVDQVRCLPTTILLCFASASSFRKVFGRSRREDLSKAAKASMSVNALATQRAQRDDALFDSP